MTEVMWPVPPFSFKPFCGLEILNWFFFVMWMFILSCVCFSFWNEWICDLLLKSFLSKKIHSHLKKKTFFFCLIDGFVSYLMARGRKWFVVSISLILVWGGSPTSASPTLPLHNNPYAIRSFPGFSWIFSMMKLLFLVF